MTIVTRTRWNLLMILLLGVGLAWIWVNRAPVGTSNAGSLSPAPAVGHPAPDFTLTTVHGERFVMSAQRGKPIVLNFWATWCPPCSAEVAELEEAHRQYAGQIVIVGVDQAEPAADVRAFAAQYGLTYLMPLDSQAEVSRKYAVRSLPTTFFIDRDGVIRRIAHGPVNRATLAQLLRTIFP